MTSPGTTKIHPGIIGMISPTTPMRTRAIPRKTLAM
jgi:hypothetical protein